MKNKSAVLKKKGSAILVTLIIVVFLGAVIVQLLGHVSGEQKFSSRSDRWNECMFLAEAGVDMTWNEINKRLTNDVSNFAFDGTDGWSTNGASGSYVFSRSFALPIFNNNNSDAQITVTASEEVYFCSGSFYTNYTLKSTASILPIREQHSVSRTVQVKLEHGYTYPGIITTNGATFHGQGRIDSYDSTKGHYTNQFGANGPGESNAFVATTAGISNGISGGNFSILGDIAVGPGGTVETNKNNFYLSGEGISDFTMDVPEVVLPAFNFDPANSNLTVSATTVLTGGSSDYVDYQINSISLSGSKNSTNTLSLSGKVRLYVTGDIDITGNGGITIEEDAEVQLYMAGSSMKLAGNGISNESDPKDFKIYGLSSFTDLSISGNGSLSSVINAPGLNVTIGGGGKDVNDFFGTMIVASLTLKGHANVHQDTSIRMIDPSNYYVQGWWEL